MRRPRKISRRKSKRSFARGAKSKKINFGGRVKRGGNRL